MTQSSNQSLRRTWSNRILGASWWQHYTPYSCPWEKEIGWTFQMEPYSVYSAQLLTRTHRTLVKSSALNQECGAIWDTNTVF